MKKLFPLFGLLVIASMILAACGPGLPGASTPTATPSDEQTLAASGWTLWDPSSDEAPHDLAVDECTHAPQPTGWYSYVWKGTVQYRAYDCADVRDWLATHEEVTPTPIPPTVTPSSTPSPAAPVCLLDKIGTFAEPYDNQNNYLGPLRIEVGGHTVQHVDFYPKPGVDAVSYIVGSIAPSETPAIWLGHGSIWQIPEGCETFDWIADATNYARARLDSNHSGIVVDLRGGTITIVANVAGLSDEEVQALLALHFASWDSFPQ